MWGVSSSGFTRNFQNCRVPDSTLDKQILHVRNSSGWMPEPQLPLCLFGLLALSTVALCQNSPYCKAIQRGAPTQIQPKQFKQMEEDALKEYARPEPYQLRATSFGNTTEKVWAVIYGEVFCNLSSDKDRATHMGALVFEWYDKSLSSRGNSVSANLTENAEAPQKQPPFEPQFEMSFLMAAVPFGSNAKPLSIHKLSDIRKNQRPLRGVQLLALSKRASRRI